MAERNFTAWLSEHRWPVYLVGLLLVTIGANAVLLFWATRPDAPRPIGGYYEQSLVWDRTLAARAVSRELGWKVSLALADAPGVPISAPRPLDLVATDAAGRPLTGLSGSLEAIRPADVRQNDRCLLVELPGATGGYRCLLRLNAAGLWEIRAQLTRGALTYGETFRVKLVPEAQP